MSDQLSQPPGLARPRVPWVTQCIVIGLLVLWAAGSVGLCLRVVDLAPTVNQNFFFSSDDPALEADHQINRLFPQPDQIVINARGDLTSDTYVETIAQMTQALARLPDVLSVQSLTQGPKNMEEAFSSPFWRRLLITDDGSSSNIFLFVEDVPFETLMPHLEAIRDLYSSPACDLVMSGPPYVIELIRRYLTRDLRVFGLATLVIFGVIVLAMFRSILMACGTLAACVSASAITLIAAHLAQIRIGVLTANLATIVAVLTLSHIVFMTFNWKHAVRTRQTQPAWTAARVTLAPSFWSMLTTLLGFGSLLFVRAEPLRQLGISGVIGTLLAFVVAFALYPWVLRAHRTDPKPERRARTTAARHARSHIGVVFGVLALALVAGLGLGRLNTDPSLLSYFAKGSELRDGLERIDMHLGSSPLNVVVQELDQAPFNSTKLYKRLWDLDQALDSLPMVGRVISLPLLIKEARRAPFARLLPLEWLIDIGESERFDRIMTYFVTEDRTKGLFVLLMQEGVRTGSRLDTITRVVHEVQAHGFETHLVGGVYMLQGKLAQVVIASLVQGLILLVVMFACLALALSRSARVALAVTAGVMVIPVWMLGLIGHSRVPFDVISAPASNLAIAMGVDAMLHLLMWVRRHRQKVSGWEAWVAARRALWQPIVYAAVIVCAGFAIFGLSAFPPTQRFGLSIVLGTLMAPVVALFLLPWLAAIPVAARNGNRR